MRFPKGKKVKKGEQRFANEGEKDDDDSSAFGSWMNPKLAAKERANMRNRNRERDRSDQFGKFEQILARSEIKYEVTYLFISSCFVNCKLVVYGTTDNELVDFEEYHV